MREEKTVIKSNKITQEEFEFYKESFIQGAIFNTKQKIHYFCRICKSETTPRTKNV